MLLLLLVVGLCRALCVDASGGSLRASVPGALRLGGLFAVHGAPATAAAGCGPVREHYGIQRVEATLQVCT